MAAEPRLPGVDQQGSGDEPPAAPTDPDAGAAALVSTVVVPGAARHADGVRERLAAALAPLLDRVGGQLVDPARAAAGDVPLVWDGTAELFVRLGLPPVEERAGLRASADLSDGLARLIAEVEAELGGRLESLRRPEKQRAVRLLEERGAFEVRRSTETVAEALGVTRFTVYNYLNRARDPQG